jgi:hypothetical protein
VSAGSAKWWSAAGVAASVVIALSANMLGSRHYARWDWTESSLYTIGRVTEETVRAITEPVVVHVLMSQGDPMTLTLRHLLEAYRAINPALMVEFIDPDRNPAELLAIQQKYGVQSGKTEGGRIVTDAQIVVARGERRHFVTAEDLFEVAPGEEDRARTRVEQVLTEAIRQVTRGEATEICVTRGHGEPALNEGGLEGLLPLQGRLQKSNYDVRALTPLRELDGEDDIDRCKVLMVAGPSVALPSDEVARYVGYVERGGSALLFVGPELDDSGRGYIDVGLGPLLALAGVKKRDDIVFERDQARRWPIGQGEAFIAEPRAHPVTDGLVELQGAINVVLTVASSFERLPHASVAVSPLLVTSPRAFGMRDFVTWAQTRPEPEPGPNDATGQLELAFALERAPGSRMVIVGTKSAVIGANWSNERLHGTALFVESAISWLAANPVVLDIPSKPAPALGANITEELLSAAALKIVVALPLSMVFLGIAVRLRRRARPMPKERDA